MRYPHSQGGRAPCVKDNDLGIDLISWLKLLAPVCEWSNPGTVGSFSGTPETIGRNPKTDRREGQNNGENRNDGFAIFVEELAGTVSVKPNNRVVRALVYAATKRF